MKHLKTYENINDIPEIGDYVQIFYGEKIEEKYTKLINYLNSNMGKVVEYDYNNENEIRAVRLKYDKIPNYIKKYFPFGHTKVVKLDFILAFGKTPEEVKLKLTANKYNL